MAGQTRTAKRLGAKQIELAVVGDYAGLVRLFERRRRELGLTCIDMDYLAGLQEGYTSKIEQFPNRHSRTLGFVSLPNMLRVLGLRLAVVKAELPADVIAYKAPSPPAEIERRGPRMAQNKKPAP